MSERKANSLIASCLMPAVSTTQSAAAVATLSMGLDDRHVEAALRESSGNCIASNAIAAHQDSAADSVRLSPFIVNCSITWIAPRSAKIRLTAAR